MLLPSLLLLDCQSGRLHVVAVVRYRTLRMMSKMAGSASSRLEESSYRLVRRSIHRGVTCAVPTFCCPSVDNARLLCAMKDWAVTGRLHARHSKEPDVLAPARNDDMAVVREDVEENAKEKNNEDGCRWLATGEHSLTPLPNWSSIVGKAASKDRLERN